MTLLQKQRIKNLISENISLKENIKYLKSKLLRQNEYYDNIKICKYCGHSPTQIPESKKDKNDRVMKGINKLKENGIIQ